MQIISGFLALDGSDQTFENEYDYNKCTAENPCKQATQELINGIHQRAPNAKLWFATGTYDLPNVVQHELNPQLLELHNNQNIMGSTSDFRHIAYDEDRPLFLGTLSWNDYSNHDGVFFTYVENIQMYTSDNHAQVEDRIVNTNLHSTGYIYVNNCLLENNSQHSGSYYGGTNIIAESINIAESNLKGEGIINIDGQENILIQQSTLEVKGKNVLNLKQVQIQDGLLVLIQALLLKTTHAAPLQ